MQSRSLLVQLLLDSMKPFVSHPERIIAVALVWFAAAAAISIWRKRLAWAPLIVAVAWSLFAGWEWHCERMGYNIRVDLLLISPVLLAVSAVAITSIFVTDFRRQQIPQQFSVRALLTLMTCVALALGAIMWLIAQ